jgi:hypothetical protein
MAILMTHGKTGSAAPAGLRKLLPARSLAEP